MTVDRSAYAPWILLVAALALGGALRFHDLSEGDLYGDEAQYALIAHSLREHPFDVSYTIDGEKTTVFASQPHLVLYLMAAAEGALGPGDLAPRAVVASFGTLGVLAAFLLGREAYGPLAGAGAALFVAVMPVHVDLSRGAMLDVPLATCLMLAAWLVLRALRTGRPRDAALAGAGAAVATLSKLPGILFVAAVVLFLAAQVLREVARHGSWSAARASTGPSAVRAVSGKDGVLRLGAAAGTLLLVLGAYLAFIAATGTWDRLASKLAWQAGRVAGEDGGAVVPWTTYFQGDHGLPAQMGTGLWVVGLAGLVVALGAWLAPARFRAPAPRAGDALVLAVVAVVFVFFAVAERKMWFYVTPVAPFLAVLGARAVVAAGRAIGRGAPYLPSRAATVAKPAAIGVLVLLVAVQVVGPAVGASIQYSEASETDGWGGNYDDVCAWIRENRADPREGVVSSLLGRYAIRFYCVDVPVHDRFRPLDDSKRAVAEGDLRWLVTDPYYADPADVQRFDQLRSAFPSVVVASFGEVDVVEFHPTNLTVDVEAPGTSSGAKDPVACRVVVTNPLASGPRDLTGEVANFTVMRYTDDGWPYRVLHVLVPLEGDWNLSAGASRTFEWTWDGRTYWDSGSAGTYHVEVAVGGESGRSAAFTRA